MDLLDELERIELVYYNIDMDNDNGYTFIHEVGLLEQEQEQNDSLLQVGGDDLYL